MGQNNKTYSYSPPILLKRLQHLVALMALSLLTAGSALAAVTSFSGGVLTISFNATDEAVTLNNDGANITLSSTAAITGAGSSFATSSVTRIRSVDLVNGTGQSLTYSSGTTIVLSGGLFSSGVETLLFYNSITTTGSSSIDLTAPQMIGIVAASLTGGTGGVQLTGQGTYEGENYGVVLRNTSTVIASGNGTVVINGTGGGGTSINSTGVVIRDESIVTSMGGNVTVTGVGGGTGNFNGGVALVFGGQISAGGSGNVTVLGTGGLGNGGGSCYGVEVAREGSRITSSGGNVMVTGYAGQGGNGPNNYGVYVSLEGQISAGGMGSVTVIGHGGQSSGYGNDGVVSFFNGMITSSGGDVNVTGYGGGTGSASLCRGVFLGNESQITAGGQGTVTVTGYGGNTSGNGNQGIYFSIGNPSYGGAEITSMGGAVNIFAVGTNNAEDINIYLGGGITSGSNAPITINANSLDFTGSTLGIINAGSGTCTIQPRTAGTQIKLGADDVLSSGSPALGLTTTELGQITAGHLIIGRDDIATGTTQVVTATNAPNVAALSLITARDIFVEANLTGGSGGLSLSANQQATPTMENFAGITITNGVTVSATNPGSVLLYGTGGAAAGTSNHGVFLIGGNISTGNGNIIVQGKKGTGTGAVGILQTGAATVSSTGGNITINDMGAWYPHNTGTDISTSSSRTLFLDANATLNIDIDGTTANTSYQQLKVNGRVHLNGTSLAFAGSTFTPVGGESFLILDNDGTESITGIFNGLPEGSILPDFLGGDLDAFITYSGGSNNNDVVITVKTPLVYCFEGSTTEDIIRFTFTENGDRNDKPSLIAPFFHNLTLYFDPTGIPAGPAWAIIYTDDEGIETLVTYNLSNSDTPPTDGVWIFEEDGVLELFNQSVGEISGLLSEGTCEPLSDCNIMVSTDCGSTLSGSYAPYGILEGRYLFSDGGNNGIFFFDIGDGNAWYLTSLDGQIAFSNPSTSTGPPASGWVPYEGGLCEGSMVTITLLDSDPPSIDCSNIVTERIADPGHCGFTMTDTRFDPFFSDQCSMATLSNDYNNSSSLAGETFPIGTTTVIWTATDAAYNTASCTIEIVVTDEEAPTIDCNNIVTDLATDPGECSFTALGNSLDPLFGDNCTALTLSNDYNSSASLADEIFPKGLTTVIWTVTDASGKMASCTINIEVTDNKNPTIDCSNIVTKRPTDPDACSFTMTGTGFDPFFEDNCPGAAITNDYNSSASLADETFPTGTTTVIWTVTDAAGNTDHCTINIEITDEEKPTIDCSNINPERKADPDECSFTVLDNAFDPASFGDNCPGVVLTNNFNNLATLAGETFPVGTTTVTWTATDGSSNTAECIIDIIITDDQPPLANCRNKTITVNGETSITLNGYDLVYPESNCDLDYIEVLPASISCDQLGQNIPVTVTLVDVNNNMASCTSQITLTGLPCGWNQNADGVNCADGNEVFYDVPSDSWLLSSSNCYYANPFTSDELSYAYYDLCGDGEITAQVTSLSSINLGWAGITMRESDAADAKKVQLTTSLSNMVRREVRYTTGGQAYPQQLFAFNRSWLRLQRIGNQFLGYASTNGVNWNLVMAVNVPMNSCIQLGLVVTNSQSSSTVIASFANVNISSTGSRPGLNLPEEGSLATTDFNISPNPTKGELLLDLAPYSGKAVRIELYNLQGQLLQSSKIAEVQGTQERMDISPYQSGMYLLKVKSDGIPDGIKRVVLSK